jgi:hypothetical protein
MLKPHFGQSSDVTFADKNQKALRLRNYHRFGYNFVINSLSLFERSVFHPIS